MQYKYSLMSALGIAVLLLAGCSDLGTSVPTGAIESPGVQFVKLPAPMNPTLKKIVTVSKLITVAQGGTIQLLHSYQAAAGQMVSLDIKLEFKPGDMPRDEWLSLSVDDDLLVTTVAMTYGPHGIVFNNPAKLTVDARGLELSSGIVAMRLFYFNSLLNVWEKMPASNAVFQAGKLDGHGKLPHFSRYAFGRIDE